MATLMASYNIERINVLSVMTDEVMGELTERYLSRLGVRHVHTVATTAAALQTLNDSEIDLVICNPEPDGSVNQVISAMRRSPYRTRRFVPIIYLAPDLSPQSANLARDAGVDEVVVPPITATQLYHHICGIIEGRRPFVRVREYFGPDRRAESESQVETERRGPDASLERNPSDIEDMAVA